MVLNTFSILPLTSQDPLKQGSRTDHPYASQGYVTLPCYEVCLLEPVDVALGLRGIHGEGVVGSYFDKAGIRIIAYS